MTVFVYILLCLIWGSTWIAIKLGLSDVPPFYGVSFRLTSAILILLVLIRYKRVQIPKSFKTIILLGLPGLLLYTTGYSTVYLAEQYIPSSMAAILISTIPFFMALGNIFLLPQEKIKPITWLGLMIGFSGVILISYDSYEQSFDLFFGAVLMLISAASAAFGTIIQKKYFSEYPVLLAVTIQMIIGWLPLVLFAILFEDLQSVHITRQFIFSVSYLAIFGSVIAFLGYYWLLKRITTISISLISFITPLVAMIIGVGFFEESFTKLTIIGTVLTLLGVLAVLGKQLLRAKNDV